MPRTGWHASRDIGERSLLVRTTYLGDVCVLAPWAEYLARGDEEILRQNYPMMKKFLAACEHRAALLSVGKHRRIWSLPFQFGDWCAPYGSVPDWLSRGPWVGTAYYFRSCRLMSEIAAILGHDEDSRRYANLAEKVRAAFCKVFTDGHGRMKEEFQTAYVLALAFGLA